MNYEPCEIVLTEEWQEATKEEVLKELYSWLDEFGQDAATNRSEGKW